MSPKNNRDEMDIDVILDEPLTSNSCVKLVIELLKYILYQKQQMPFTYDTLTQLRAKVKHTDKNSTPISAFLNSLKMTAEQLSSHFQLSGCEIKEIAILVGATIMSPKFYIRIELPADILSSQSHFECKHPPGKPLLKLMRAMLECTKFQDALTLPLSPTNTFVLIQKCDDNSLSEFFLPKPQYHLPTHATCFKINLSHREEMKINCNCADLVRVYDDVSDSYNIDRPIIQDNSESANASFNWYQSKEIIKGFKYVR